jgi:hypothetical protein
LKSEQGALAQKSLRKESAVRLAEMTPEDGRLLGALFASCATAAGGDHEAQRGASINEATLLRMTAEHAPQTIHADDVVQSLAIIYNASKVAVMGPEFLNQKPIILTGVGIQPTTDQGRTVNALPSLWKPTVHTAALGQLFVPCSSSHTLAHSPTCLTCAQNRMKLIKMWTALEGSEANPDVKESGILQPGDAVFFNPTHPHRGPRAPFPSTEGGGAGSEGGGGASGGKRTMIFMSACHTKGSSEGGAIFASAPAAPRQGRVWRDAFAITQEERAKVVEQSVLESPRKKPRKRAAHPDAGP